ncbi:MAG: putative quinol monooxygenase [Alphaproteobacteria bacterium]
MHILAEIVPKTEFWHDALEAVIGILDITNQEIGCHRFELYTDYESSRFFLIEHWESQAAFDFHHAQNYTKAVFKSYENWLAEPPRIIRMNKVEP